MTKIFAHRGSSGTHPENTFAAYIEAERVGADGIEIDVHYTKDNKLAVIHDKTVDRTTNGKGRVRDHTLSELQELDAGLWFSPKFKGEYIPSLTEVLTWLQDNDLVVNIELKYAENKSGYEQFEEKVLHEIKVKNMQDRVIISSFNQQALKKVNKLNPQIECGLIYMKKLNDPIESAVSTGATALHIYAKITDDDFVSHALKEKFAVRIFTVNKRRHIKRFLQTKCSALITDFPQKALDIKEKINGLK